MDAPGRPRTIPAALVFVGAGLLFGLAAGLIVFYGLPSLPSFGSGVALSGGPNSTPAPAPVVGAPAPNFRLKDIAGDDVELASFKGQVVLLNFWATWCGPCEAEMPAIEERYQTFKSQGFTVLGVNLDEPVGDVVMFINRLGVTFPILLDPGATVFDLYRVRGYPTTFFIDRAGLIVTEHVGIMSDGQLDRYLLEVGLGGS
jgi:peroxiredoxin